MTRRYDRKETNTNAGPLRLLAAAAESDGSVNQEMLNVLLNQLTLTLSRLVTGHPSPIGGRGSKPTRLLARLRRSSGRRSGGGEGEKEFHLLGWRRPYKATAVQRVEEVSLSACQSEPHFVKLADTSIELWLLGQLC